MAIAYANSLDGVAASSFSFDALATTNGLVIGMVRGGVAEADNKSATFGGVSMNKMGYLVLPTDRSLTVFWIIAPLSGSQTIAFSGGSINRTAASSYTGVKQTGQPDVAATPNTATTGTSFSSTVTVSTAGSWLIGSMSSVNNVNSAGAGTTVRINTNQTDLVDSNGGLSAGSQSLTLTTGTNDNWGGIVAAFSPAASAAANSGFFLAAR